MPDPPHIRDLDVLRDVQTIRAVAHEQRLAILALLTRGRFTVAMLAEQAGLPQNRVHYHLRRLTDCGLVIETHDGPRRRATERFYTAAAHQFIVDPGLGLHDPGMLAAIDSSLQSMLLEWRRRSLLKIDLSTIARRIALDCAQVSEGDHVLVAFGRFGAELGEAVLVEIESAGAHGIIRPWSHNWLCLTLDRASEEGDRPVRFVPDRVTDTLDAAIFITTGLPEGPPPTPEQVQKLPLMLDEMTRWKRRVLARGVRYVEFSLPFRSEFESKTMSPEDGTTIFWKAMMADLDAIGHRGERIRERLVERPDLELTSSEDATLRLSIDPDTVAVRDGVISRLDVAQFRPAESLPGGGVVAIPRPEQTNGMFVADYAFWSGVHVQRPRIRVHDGRIVDVQAESQVEFLRSMLGGATGDADLISMVSFGLNPAGRGPTGKISLDVCLEGVVTIHFGNNELIGGDVASTLDLGFPNATLTVAANDTVLVRDGEYLSDPADRQAPRYSRSGLGAADAAHIADKLVSYLEASRAYLNPDLRMADVAEAVSVSSHHLSQALHQALETSFLVLVNRYRLEEFKRRLADPGSRDHTFLGIALDVGFSSKASFYRVFRRETGMTPAEFDARRRGAD